MIIQVENGTGKSGEQKIKFLPERDDNGRVAVRSQGIEGICITTSNFAPCRLLAALFAILIANKAKVSRYRA